MGLDVYLYKYTQFAERIAAEQAREERHEANWQAMQNGRKYEDLSESEKESVRAKNEAEDAANPLPGTTEKIEIPSAKHPEHYFKVGYLRSSYNDSGINNILRNLLGKDKDLHSIFDVTREDYHVRPDWQTAKDKALALLVEFNRHVEENGFMCVMDVTHNAFIDPRQTPGSEKEALDIFARLRREQMGRRDGEGGNFSNRDGHFFFSGDGFKVRALLPGRYKSFAGEQLATYVVYEGEADWYRQALEITIEMCDWVLSQPADPAVEYVLHWSG